MTFIETHELNFELWKDLNLLNLEVVRALFRGSPITVLGSPSSVKIDIGSLVLCPAGMDSHSDPTACLNWFDAYLENCLWPLYALSDPIDPLPRQRLQEAIRAVAVGLGTERHSGLVLSLEEAIDNIEMSVRGLRRDSMSSPWVYYAMDCSYGEPDRTEKLVFVSEALSTMRPRRLIDLGANTCLYSFLGSHWADEVIAIDSDRDCMDIAARITVERGAKGVVPLVVNLDVDVETTGSRPPEMRFDQRIKSDAFLALALIHHLCAFRSRSIGAFLDLLCRFGRRGVLEWVDIQDAIVRQQWRAMPMTLKNDYTQEVLESELVQRFDIVRTKVLSSKTRTLYHLGELA